MSPTSVVLPAMLPATCARLAAARWAWLALAAAAPLPLLAQIAGRSGDGFLFRQPVISLSIRGGYDRPTGRSDLYDFVTDQLTLGRGDFAAFGYQADLGVRLTNRLELVMTGGESKRTAPSEFRDFIDNDDQPIEQTTTLHRVPLSLGLKFALTSPGERISKLAWIPSRFTPWAGAGGGMTYYTFSQRGDFVDFETLRVFNRRFRSDGWAPMAYANVGADLRVTTRLALTGDLRYSVSRGTLNRQFDGFEKIDLSGSAATLGLTVRY